MLNYPLSGNTRVISQDALEHFRESLSTRKNDPYSVLLKRNKLPMSLLDDAARSGQGKVRRFIYSNCFSGLSIYHERIETAHRRDRAILRYVWTEGPAEEAQARCWQLRRDGEGERRGGEWS